ncbi:MAG: cupin domain-containing protein [Pseudomonadota bacterium]
MSRMTDEEFELAFIALGCADPEEARALEARLRASPALQGLVEDRAVELAALAQIAEPATPPPELFARIEAEIDAETAPESETVRAEAGRWIERWPGIWLKSLHRGAEDGVDAYLLRCEPGAVIPNHRHARDEHVFVLEGALCIGALRLGTGDSHLARAGSTHPPARTEAGCLVMVRC